MNTAFTKTVTESCEQRIVTLSCGCVEITPVTIEDVPVREDQPVCGICGKFHHYETEQKVFQDCTTHIPFFLRWPMIERRYFVDRCPQFGMGPDDAEDLLLQETLGSEWTGEKRQELVDVIASATDEYRDSRAYTAIRHKQINQEQRNQIAKAITKFSTAQSSLKRNLVTGKAKRRLQWVVAKWQAIFWGIRLAAIVLAIAALIWHLPDWRTVLTLVAIGAAVCVFVDSPRDWFEGL